MANKKTTQTQAILNHLMSGKSITSMEAFERYGATRLSGLIFVLRKRGYHIISETKECTTRYGETAHYAEYRLIKE